MFPMNHITGYSLTDTISVRVLKNEYDNEHSSSEHLHIALGINSTETNTDCVKAISSPNSANFLL